MPVLPEVGSTSTPRPGEILPCASSASIIATPIRSLTLPIGLKNSSFPRRRATTPFSLAIRSMATSGVSPIVSVIEGYIFPRPGARAAPSVVVIACLSLGAVGPASSADPTIPSFPDRFYTTLGISTSDSKISGGLFVVENVRLFCVLAHGLDGNRIEIGEESLARLSDGGIDHSFEQKRICAEIVRIGRAQRHRSAHDFADGDPTALPREFVASARPAHAF